jgi:Protein of unknown function (DUF1653)
MSRVSGRQASLLTGPLPPPGRYRHFKGDEYELLSVGAHTETEELLVVYRSIDEPEKIWIRPLQMFVEPVDQPCGRVPRFRPADQGVARSQNLWSAFKRLADRISHISRRTVPL